MNLGQNIEYWGKERAKEPALISEDRIVSFVELDKLVNRLANGLRNLGIKKGDRVAIMLPNTPDFVYTFYACQKLGAVAVPFNTMYKGREISHILRDSGAKAIVCLTNSVPLINEIRSELPDLEHIITTGERTLTFADPKSNLFIQAVLSKAIFPDLDGAYHKIGKTLLDSFCEIGLKETWYRHRGSLRIYGKKLAGFLISDIEDVYIINIICFLSRFQPYDFFYAIWVPPEVKDKILEPLTSVEEELGRRPSNEEFKNIVTANLEKSFGIKLNEGGLTREEKFGYEKQRTLAFKRTVRPSSQKKSIFAILFGKT